MLLQCGRVLSSTACFYSDFTQLPHAKAPHTLSCGELLEAVIVQQVSEVCSFN